MKNTLRATVALAVAAAVGSPALAQPAAPLDVYLEQRVTEELTTEGMLLSRLGVALDVQVTAGTAIVSLVDLGTGRAVASTKLDQLPTEHAAAVAALTVVASNLVGQLASASDVSAAATLAARAALEADREQRDRREQAEERYRREAITFSTHVVGRRHGTETVIKAYRGTRLVEDRDELLLVLGREDLVRERSRRGSMAELGLIAGSVGVLFGAGLYVAAESNDRDGDEGIGAVKLGAAAIMAGGVIGMLAGLNAASSTLYTERDLQDWAEQHNARLRAKHGLPAAAAAPARDGRRLGLAPYFGGSGGGLSVSGRF